MAEESGDSAPRRNDCRMNTPQSPDNGTVKVMLATSEGSHLLELFRASEANGVAKTQISPRNSGEFQPKAAIGRSAFSPVQCKSNGRISTPTKPVASVAQRPAGSPCGCSTGSQQTNSARSDQAGPSGNGNCNGSTIPPPSSLPTMFPPFNPAVLANLSGPHSPHSQMQFPIAQQFHNLNLGTAQQQQQLQNSIFFFNQAGGRNPYPLESMQPQDRRESIDSRKSFDECASNHTAFTPDHLQAGRRFSTDSNVDSPPGLQFAMQQMPMPSRLSLESTNGLRRNSTDSVNIASYRASEARRLSLDALELQRIESTNKNQKRLSPDSPISSPLSQMKNSTFKPDLDTTEDRNQTTRSTRNRGARISLDGGGSRRSSIDFAAGGEGEKRKGRVNRVSQHNSHNNANANATGDASGNSVPKPGTTEGRALAVERFLRKRARRSFTKKVRYAGRKELADARPRVRGMFVKATDSPKTPGKPGS